MAIVTIPFGKWFPNLPDLANPGATIAKNVIPYRNGYKKFPSLSVVTSALTAYARGFIAMKDTSNIVYNFAGDATKLYQKSDTSWTDVSRLAGGAYTNAAEDLWEFTKYGNTCIAVNGIDAPQAVTLGGVNFAALAGSPPTGRVITTINQFAVMGNIVDTPNRVRWSALGDSASWAISPTTQADQQDLQGNGGAVKGLVGGANSGIVFQERAIQLMTYVSTPFIFQFDAIAEGLGLLAQKGFAAWGGSVFFIGNDYGFYMLNGGVPTPLKDIDKYFYDDLDVGNIFRISTVYDPINRLFVMGYPGAGNTAGNPNKLAIYDPVDNQWSYAEVNVELLCAAIATGYTIDSIDSLASSIDALDSIIGSLDDSSLAGGTLNFSAFNSSNRFGNFAGAAMDAVIETGEFEAAPGQRSFITEARPLIDGGSHTVQMGTRNTQAGTNSFAAASSENSDGFCPVRSNARYHRVRANITGEWTSASGVQIDVEPEGDR